MQTPTIIQGGMGAGVSRWQLARAVSRAGHLGVVSGTPLDVVFTRKLQCGDPGGHMRRAMRAFPYPQAAQRVLDRYFVPGGKAQDARFRAKPVPALVPSRHLLEVLVVANFVEIYLAKEGHDGLVGVNYLEKIQLPNLPSLYGAMLAGVDFVLMGAGIPRHIPGVLDRLSEGEAVELPIAVEGVRSGPVARFDPREFCGEEPPRLSRPKFLAIVSTATLANMLCRKANGHVDGFVIEGPTAGGHNAPPRGKLHLSDSGEPIYSERDVADLAAFRELGRPFWLAGSWGRPGRLEEALAHGAAGIQVGTLFAYSKESGITPEIKRRVLKLALDEAPRVRTDPRASPTGFPLKIVELAGTVADSGIVAQRKRICDLGYLRHAYQKPDGTLGWRCPSEPVDHYVRKGGAIEDTVGRLCVCNGLAATIGLEQVLPDGSREPPLVTSGDDLARIGSILKNGGTDYSAADVIDLLLGRAAGTTAEVPVSCGTA